MLGVFVGQLGVLEDVSQDFCHLHWVDFRCMGLGCVLDSPLSWYSTWRRNGSGALVHPGKQAATARKWFISYFLDCSCCQTKGFSHLIYITTKCYSSYQQYYNYYPYYKGCWEELAKRIHNLYLLWGVSFEGGNSP